MGKLHDKTVKKLIKEKPSVRHADGNFKTLNDLYADYYELRKREIASHHKEKSLFEREVAWRIGKVELEKIRPVDISEILRDVATGYDDNKPRPTLSNDLMRLLRNLFDHGIKLDVTRFNPASPFRPRDAGGEEKAANYPMNEDDSGEPRCCDFCHSQHGLSPR